MSISEQLVLHWSPPDNQLSPVAPRSCSFGRWAKPGEGSQSGLKPSGEPDRGCLPKTGPGGVSGRERLSSNGHEGGDSKQHGGQKVRQGSADVAIHCSLGSPRS